MKHFRGNRKSGVSILLLGAALLLPWAAAADDAATRPETGSISGRVFLDENADTFFEDCDCDCALENIPVRLYPDHCGGQIIQTVRTDKEGYFHFVRLEPGDYCVMPDAKMICEGYQPTKSLTQKVHVTAGENVEAEWFGLDHYLDINESASNSD